jgi:hypothetical protein
MLFASWRRNSKLAIPDLENGVVRIAFAFLDLDPAQAFEGHLLHFLGDRVIAVSG